MSESEIEGFINKVESGLVEAQHDMLVEKALYNRPVVISDGNGGGSRSFCQAIIKLENVLSFF